MRCAEHPGLRLQGTARPRHRTRSQQTILRETSRWRPRTTTGRNRRGPAADTRCNRGVGDHRDPEPGDPNLKRPRHGWNGHGLPPAATDRRGGLGRTDGYLRQYRLTSTGCEPTAATLRCAASNSNAHIFHSIQGPLHTQPGMTVHPLTGRTALVHDWLNQAGGAENVLEVLHGMFPSAPIYTSLYVPQCMPDTMRNWDIRTSWLNRIPGRDRLARYLLPLYPGAFRGMNLASEDLVISIKSAFCLGVRTASGGNKARHVCYCLTPTRFLWHFDQYMAREQVSGPARLASRLLLEHLRRWELEAARGVDDFIAISTAVQKRIRDIYGRSSTIIHPPVDTGAFRPKSSNPRNNFYLVVSRLIPYKRIDLAISAFNHMPDRNLVIVGDGRDTAALKAMAGPNIRFTDYLPRREVVDLMQQCRGFIFPGEEDFGITPVEAMSAGSPVVALRAGGALDTVADRQTGVFFDSSEPEALCEAIEAADTTNWDREVLYRQADQFSTELFRKRFRRFLATA